MLRLLLNKNFDDRKFSKDTSNYNSYRSKLSTENNIYQSRYDEQSIIKTMKLNNALKGRVRLSSQREKAGKNIDTIFYL